MSPALSLYFENRYRQVSTESMIRTIARRNFSSSAKRLEHGPEGAYSNLPFKVHNRRVPYAVLHFGFFAVGLGTPFAITYYYLKKAGNL